MQGMGQDVDLDVAPGEQSPIHPDQPIAIVIRNEVGHARQSPSLVIIVWRNRGAIVCSEASWRAAVLKQLVDEGFVIQRAGSEDRRERRLYLSAKGTRLTDKLTQIQVKRVAEALATLGPGADQLARKFLFAMITEKDRPLVEVLIKGPHADIAAETESHG